MTVLVFDPSQFEKFWSDINLLDVVKRGIHSGAMRVIPLLQDGGRHAIPASQNGAYGAFNTGRYVGGWQVDRMSWGSVVYNRMPYSSVIEEGRRAGSSAPPKEAIEKWALRRLGLSKDAAKQAAWPIARAIGRRGLRPRKVMSDPATKQRIYSVVKDEIRREISRATGGP